jgi:hypothetical protein
MALQKTVTTASGVQLTDAYHKITHLRWDEAHPDRVRFTLCSYVGQAQADAGDPPVEKKEYALLSFDKAHVTDNIHTQAYDWLKDPISQSGFDADTTDV